MTNITPTYLVLAILVMALITFFTRITPVVLPKRWLDSAVFHAVNQGLPLAVMVLLVLTSLTWLDHQQHFYVSKLLVAQIFALLTVLISYHCFKQLFVSMIIGIASLNLFLYFLN